MGERGLDSSIPCNYSQQPEQCNQPDAATPIRRLDPNTPSFLPEARPLREKKTLKGSLKVRRARLKKKKKKKTITNERGERMRTNERRERMRRGGRRPRAMDGRSTCAKRRENMSLQATFDAGKVLLAGPLDTGPDVLHGFPDVPMTG